MTEYKYGDVLEDTRPMIEQLRVMYLCSAPDTSPYEGSMGMFLVLHTARAFESIDVCVWALTNWKKIDED